jgi:hypothetical protein
MDLKWNKEGTIAPKEPFRYGDAVFFTDGAWYGSPPGMHLHTVQPFKAFINNARCWFGWC